MLAAKNLGTCVGSRDNNFNLIRLIAAYSVLVGHSWPLAQGESVSDPLGRLTGHHMGALAVEVFFFTSGFLVTGSILSRGNLWAYAKARGLRIFPGLWVAMILSVIVLGLGFSSLPAREYFTSSKTLGFLVETTTFLIRGFDHLPGVFTNNPAPNAVNGSLWTLPRELKKYILLGAVWFASARLLRDRLPRVGGWQVFDLIILGIATVGIGLHFIQHFVGWPHGPVATTGVFFMGAAAYVLRDRIVLRGDWFFVCLAALLISSVNEKAFFVAVHLTLAYLVLWLAYIPANAVVRSYNRLGDYSYGTYIYAFPIQQAVAVLVPGVTPWGMMAWASPVTLVLAVASWHLVEERALRLKARVVGASAPQVRSL